MNNVLLHEEKISSRRTELLFLILTVLFFGLFLWRAAAIRFDFPAGLFLFLSFLFLFYSLNYRRLSIQLSSEHLQLTFGIFTWRIPLGNIAGCGIDEIPPFMRFGGAGIHFMFIRGRYRASFNFLEFPRVVITLRRQVGPVRDVSFSTRQPEELIRRILGAIATTASRN